MHACMLAYMAEMGIICLIINAIEQALALQIKDTFPFLIALNNCYRRIKYDKFCI